MRLHSLEELECLLPDDMREKARKEREQRELNLPPFNFMKTENRVLPLLPRWMKNKLSEARILFGHNNTCYGSKLLWNHTITLPLDGQHDVTFAILDNYSWNGDLRASIKKIVEVYKDLQVLYRKFGHSLSIVSLQTDDFGMLLPYSFYEDGTTIDEEAESVESLYASLTKKTAREFMNELKVPRYPKMYQMKKDFKEYADTLDEDERKQAYAEFNDQQAKRLDYYEKVKAVLDPMTNCYGLQFMWDCVDLYMDGPKWGREFCVKWNIGENVELLKRLDALRPLIDAIVEKTESECFAFGVKKRGTVVVPCDPISVRCRMMRSA